MWRSAYSAMAHNRQKLYAWKDGEGRPRRCDWRFLEFGGLDDDKRERYRDLLRRVGLGDEEPVVELVKVFADGIGRLLELEHHGRAKSFITEITPLRYMMDYYSATKEHEQERARNAMRKAVDWAAMRWIGRLLEKIKTNGKGYRPQPLRRVNIRKREEGFRTLSLPTTTDRIVSKSAVLVVQPVMEGVFLPSSVGCRNEKDRFDALATIADRYPGSPSKIIIVADIQHAYLDARAFRRLVQRLQSGLPKAERACSGLRTADKELAG